MLDTAIDIGAALKVRRTRSRDGFFLTDGELKAVAELVEKSKMDIWFGEVREFLTSGDSTKLVHLVKNKNTGRFVGVKSAVKWLLESVTDVQDFVSPRKARTLMRLAVTLGLYDIAGRMPASRIDRRMKKGPAK